MRRRLLRLLAALERTGRAPAEQFLDLLEVMTVYEKYLTAEQLAQLERRAEELGPEGLARCRRGWADVFRGMHAAMVGGTDPRDPGVQDLLRRADALTVEYVGDDPVLLEALHTMYRREGAAMARWFMPKDPAFWAYWGRARAASGRPRPKAARPRTGRSRALRRSAGTTG